MKLVVINPNSTASMTDKILASARAVAAPAPKSRAAPPTAPPPASRAISTR